MTQPTGIVKSSASLLNSVKDTSSSFVGYWDDVKDYNTLIVTLQSPMDGSGTLKWANTTRRQFPSDEDVIAEEPFLYSATQAKTLQWDHRGRWFKLEYTDTSTGPASYDDFSLNIETLYKGIPTEPKIADDQRNVVNLHDGDVNSSYQTVFADVSGVPLATTDDGVTVGEALYVHLRDASSDLHYAHTNTTGTSPESLFIALRDDNNDNLTTTPSGNTLHAHPSDMYGHSQAGTIEVSGAHTSGRALYLTGADNTGAVIATTDQYPDDTGSNSLYVHLTLSGGEAVNHENPVPCYEADKIAQTVYFDISQGITTNLFHTTTDLSNGHINMFNLFTYNDGPVTVWTKLYDASIGNINSLADTGTILKMGYNIDMCDNITDVPFAENMGAAGSRRIGPYATFFPGPGEAPYVSQSVTVGSQVITLTFSIHKPGLDPFAQSIGLVTGGGTVIYLNEIKAVAPLLSGYTNAQYLTVSPNTTGTVQWDTSFVIQVTEITGELFTYENYNDRVLLNVATPAGQYRDFKFPRGMLFCNGLHFRSSTEHSYDSSAGPGDDVLFVNGAYYKSYNPSDIDACETIDYGSRGLDDAFEGAKVAEMPTFPGLPESEVGDEPGSRDLTGLEDMEDEVDSKTIAFQADGENHIKGSVTFSYNAADELLSLSTLVNTSVHPLKEISFCYDEMGNQVQYDIDISELEFGTPLTTENIGINDEQLATAKVLIVLNNEMEVNIAYNGV
jgi:hypothetical protein